MIDILNKKECAALLLKLAAQIENGDAKVLSYFVMPGRPDSLLTITIRSPLSRELPRNDVAPTDRRLPGISA